MGPSRRRLGWLCAGLILAAAGSGSAQTTRVRRPQPPPAASAPDNTVGNVTGEPGLSSAVPGSPGRLPLAPPPAPPVLRSAIRSRYSRPAVIGRSTTGQCRVGCAVARNACANGQGDTSGCDPGWTQCLSACAGLSYSRGP